MTLICNDGHSEHDELSCVRTFFRGKYPVPKYRRMDERYLPMPAYRPFPKRSAQAEKSPKMIPRFTI